MNEIIPMGKAEVKKELVKLPSGKYAEAIYLNRQEKRIICLSSQISCGVGCDFCASSNTGKTKNLTIDDMLTEIDTMYKYSPDDATNPILISFMGEGEPLLNYKNVIGTIHEIEKMYDNCRVAVSTSGASPNNIKELAHETFIIPFKLQVSIHSMIAEVREWLMPCAKSIKEIKNSLEYYKYTVPEQPIDLNFTLIKGINDTYEDAYEIINEFKDYHIKLSKFNPVKNKEYESSSDEHINKFKSMLLNAGLSVEYHISDGSEDNSSCGQLRATKEFT